MSKVDLKIRVNVDIFMSLFSAALLAFSFFYLSHNITMNMFAFFYVSSISLVFHYTEYKHA